MICKKWVSAQGAKQISREAAYKKILLIYYLIFSLLWNPVLYTREWRHNSDKLRQTSKKNNNLSVPKTIFKTKIWCSFYSYFSQNMLMLSDSGGAESNNLHSIFRRRALFLLFKWVRPPRYYDQFSMARRWSYWRGSTVSALLPDV